MPPKANAIATADFWMVRTFHLLRPTHCSATFRLELTAAQKALSAFENSDHYGPIPLSSLPLLIRQGAFLSKHENYVHLALFGVNSLAEMNAWVSKYLQGIELAVSQVPAPVLRWVPTRGLIFLDRHYPLYVKVWTNADFPDSALDIDLLSFACAVSTLADSLLGSVLEDAGIFNLSEDQWMAAKEADVQRRNKQYTDLATKAKTSTHPQELQKLRDLPEHQLQGIQEELAGRSPTKGLTPACAPDAAVWRSAWAGLPWKAVDQRAVTHQGYLRATVGNEQYLVYGLLCHPFWYFFPGPRETEYSIGCVYLRGAAVQVQDRTIILQQLIPCRPDAPPEEAELPMQLVFDNNKKRDEWLKFITAAVQTERERIDAVLSVRTQKPSSRLAELRRQELVQLLTDLEAAERNVLLSTEDELRSLWPIWRTRARHKPRPATPQVSQKLEEVTRKLIQQAEEVAYQSRQAWGTLPPAFATVNSTTTMVPTSPRSLSALDFPRSPFPVVAPHPNASPLPPSVSGRDSIIPFTALPPSVPSSESGREVRLQPRTSSPYLSEMKLLVYADHSAPDDSSSVISDEVAEQEALQSPPRRIWITFRGKRSAVACGGEHGPLDDAAIYSQCGLPSGFALQYSTCALRHSGTGLLVHKGDRGLFNPAVLQDRATYELLVTPIL
eukprot:TRINITY_DN8495_c0_g1_i1.p1 TRINITY_DN8495_c0_g1~~TRINITY_DN8495_c0_g1_i1.p1  ORF type:complete len:669 (-),score=93.53 TRINITY_DN8495_c0_g1_i1:38-2044(-)